MRTAKDDAVRALCDFAILLEAIAAFFLVWVMSWMPIWKGHTEANGINALWLFSQGLFFVGLFLIVSYVTIGAKKRRYPPLLPGPVVPSATVPTQPQAPPSVEAIQKQIENLEEEVEELKEKEGET